MRTQWLVFSIDKHGMLCSLMVEYGNDQNRYNDGLLSAISSLTMRPAYKCCDLLHGVFLSIYMWTCYFLVCDSAAHINLYATSDEFSVLLRYKVIIYGLVYDSAAHINLYATSDEFSVLLRYKVIIYGHDASI